VQQVLVTGRNVSWQPDSDGRVPSGALAVGRTQTGETLYMARVDHDYTLTPGKVPVLTCLLYKKRMLSGGRTLLHRLVCYVTL
jgi:hypothetical protein